MEGPVDVARGVTRVATRTPTLPPATHTNSYALGTAQVLLIEPAPSDPDEQRAWIDWARAIASSKRELVAILVTHHHVDHAGGAAHLAAELGLPLWGHRETGARLDGAALGRELVDGELIALGEQRWRVLHTPGHAPGHLCLYEPAERVAVVGDMVASTGTILIDPVEGDLEEYIAQLERLAALDLELALPAHGDPIARPEALFRRYISHRRMRETKVVAALEAAGEPGGDLDALVARAYDDTPASLWPLAKLSLEAHLIALVRQGRARAGGGRWWPTTAHDRGATDT